MEPSIKGDHCLNCRHPLTGAWCEACGQAAHTDRITFRETFQTFLSSAFLIEGRYAVTIRRLITDPGRLFREYLGGMRASYYKPVAFFILNTAVYILIRALVEYDPLAGTFNNMDGEKVPGSFRYYESAARFMVNNINYILFTLVFAIAIWFKAFYRRRYFLAEYTAIGFYIAGLYILFSIVTMLLNVYTDLHISSGQLILLATLIFYCAVRFIRPFTFASVFKCLAISLLSVAFYMLFSFGLSLLFVMLKS